VIKGESTLWEVEGIKDSRLQRGKLEYLVKWKDYPQEESTWEPADNVKYAKRLVDNFHAIHPAAPRRISAVTFSRLPFRPYTNFTEWPSSKKIFDWTAGKHIGDNVP
jgi:hypothetical protein